MINLDESLRTKVKLNDRLQIVCGKIHQTHNSKLDQNIPIGMFLNLFDTMVSPVFCMAVHSCHLIMMNSEGSILSKEQ